MKPEFVPNEATQERIAAVYKLLAWRRRGETVPNVEISEALGGTPPNVDDFRYAVDGARRRLLEERGIACEPIVGVGIRLYTKGDQLLVEPRRRFIKARRQYVRAKKALVALPASDLTDGECRWQNFLLEAVEQARRQADRELRAAEASCRAPEAPPDPERQAALERYRGRKLARAGEGQRSEPERLAAPPAKAPPLRVVS